jgi:phospholipase C
MVTWVVSSRSSLSVVHLSELLYTQVEVQQRPSTADKLNYCDVMHGFNIGQLPVITALAQEFAIMDEYFASVPGPTWPNRMFALSGTSAGSTSTSVWFQNEQFQLFPQATLFDQLESANLTWKNYYNDTPWELFMAKVAHSPDNLQPMDKFYSDAAQGNIIIDGLFFVVCCYC